MRAETAISIFLHAKRAKGLSPETLRSYGYRLGTFQRFYPEVPFSPTTIENFLIQVGPTLDTKDTYYRLLRNFYRFLVKKKLSTSNPITEVEPIRLKRKIARSLTQEELSKLLTYNNHQPRLRAFLFLLADTGIRLSEALSVNPSSCVDGLLSVNGKTGERIVPISPAVKCMVLSALPWPWANWQTAGLAVRRAFKKAGVKGSAHTIRHTFCRLWQGDETSLQGIMGWTTPRMMSRYRPYDLSRAKAQHHQFTPTNGTLTAHQLTFF